MKLIAYLLVILVTLGLSSCNDSAPTFDASGSFEAVEIIISAQSAGVINQFQIDEGQRVTTQQVIGYIDTTQLHLKKAQLQIQIQALLSRKPNVSLQLAGLNSQLKTAKSERNRVERLLEEDAATTKQLDDLNAQIDMLEKQISAQRSTLSSNVNGIELDANSLNYQLDQINDQIQKSIIVAPMDGTILEKYAQQFEMVQPGKPLFKMANLSPLILRAYLTADQLSQVQLNQKVTVLSDDKNGHMNTAVGEISWISEEAEFTPKTIQTKAERANLVYAIKVRVPNNGQFKIGMYGAIKLD